MGKPLRQKMSTKIQGSQLMLFYDRRDESLIANLLTNNRYDIRKMRLLSNDSLYLLLQRTVNLLRRCISLRKKYIECFRIGL